MTSVVGLSRIQFKKELQLTLIGSLFLASTKDKEYSWIKNKLIEENKKTKIVLGKGIRLEFTKLKRIEEISFSLLKVYWFWAIWTYKMLKK
jgi:hypothetical protein